LLKSSGYFTIACCFPEQFRSLAEDEDLPFYSLGTEFLELLDTADGRDIMGADLGKIAKVKLYWKLYKDTKVLHDKHMQIEQYAIQDFQPDLIIYHVKSIYPTAWEAANPGKTLMLSPVPCIVKKTSAYPTLGFSFSLGEWFNKMTYSLTNAAIVSTVKSYNNRLKSPLDISKAQIKKAYKETPMVYTVSPSLFPVDKSWGEETHLVGYQERNKTSHWTPSDEIKQFLDQHDKVLLLTFGSMINPDPEGKTKILTDILTKHKIPTLINIAAGGLVDLPGLDSDLFHVVKRIPYDWLLPQVYGVIHHGGSGTTHLTAKYGCVSMIIPHIIDQFLWDRLSSDRGMGPRGISVSKLSSQIESKILDLYQNQEYKTAALKVSGEMHREDYSKRIVTLISNQLKVSRDSNEA